MVRPSLQVLLYLLGSGDLHLSRLFLAEIINKLDLDERIFSLEVLNHIFKSVNFELLIESASSMQRFNEASMPWNLEVKNHEN